MKSIERAFVVAGQPSDMQAGHVRSGAGEPADRRNGRKRRIGRRLIVAGAGLALAIAMAPAPAGANLIADHSFEIESNPLSGLGAVVGPPFQAGIWGVENATIVTSENGITPPHATHMLRMEDEGLFVTQAFQAVDVSADSVCIDAGGARISLSALLNTVADVVPPFPPVQGGVRLYFFGCSSCWGSSINEIGNNILLDGDPNTWEMSSVVTGIPAGTRWVLVQLGFTDSTLYGRPGYADDVRMDIDTSGCHGTPVITTSWGRIKEQYR